MIKKLLNIVFNTQKGLDKKISQINGLESQVSELSNEGLRERSLELKAELVGGKTLDDILPEAFALVRETSKRLLKQRHFDVQLKGGIALHSGKIAEMMTGEGKTLAATAPVYLNALAGKGVHVITVNDYLAKRDMVWMGQIYHFLGLSVACLIHDQAYVYDPSWKAADNQLEKDAERDLTGSFMIQEDYLRPVTRREAYLADITYGTNHEFGFDYLRDNLVAKLEQQVQRGQNFAIIDEVDSILIDEARTPLIISAPDAESSNNYKIFTKIVAQLEKGAHYEVDEKLRSVNITQEGIDEVEKALGIENFYSPENLRLSHYLQESLKAHGLFKLDKDYVVKNDEVIIVDQFTGRMLPGRRYSAGLHQAIEAKEGVKIQNESRTYASITIQNYFRLYKKIAGMTGTAQTSAEEFDKVYKLEVVSIPTNHKLIRKDLVDLIYKNKLAKYKAIIEDVKVRHTAGQPILIGTVSISNNEELSQMLSLAGIKHEVLNAKNHEREGMIIAQAGRLGGVTVATNMAGRGVDIILGGNPVNGEEAKKVKDLGGLYVVATERHEARRIDNQLRGRAGRWGDPGLSQFYLSLDDDILRIFGGDRLKSMMTTLDIPEDMPISSSLVGRAVSQAQSKIEGLNFDARKHLLDYDDVINKQRLAIYRKRQEMLETKAHPQLLSVLDLFWMNQLENIEALMESVRLRAYGQHDPLVEFRREAHILYTNMLRAFDDWYNEHKDQITAWEAEKENKLSVSSGSDTLRSGHYEIPMGVDLSKIERNDPCPCGSGKKFKKCHGLNI